MGFFDAIFGKKRAGASGDRPPPDKIKWIRALAKKRVIQDPVAGVQGFTPAMVEQLPPEILIGLPEGTLVTIVETFALLKAQEVSDADALQSIERYRSVIASGLLPSPLSLESYIEYRIDLEHSDCSPLPDGHIADCVLMARTLYKC